jgi:NAD(P)-dependent dehydrogenase (short-subunit alcohol dehydrogenase family)
VPVHYAASKSAITGFTLALAREEVQDESVWNSAFAEGRTMAFEQAITYALEVTDR